MEDDVAAAGWQINAEPHITIHDRAFSPTDRTVVLRVAHDPVVAYDADVRNALSVLVQNPQQEWTGRAPFARSHLKREQIPLRVRAAKGELQVLETERLRLATQEADAANQLALEQDTWSDLNRSLDELERSLAQPRRQ